MAQQSPHPSPLPSAPDSPALLVTGTVQKYTMKKKKILNAEESELFELTQAAGITMDQEVFKIIVDLLKMNVAPQAVFQTLKAMCAGQRIADSFAGESSTASHAAGTTTITASTTTTTTTTSTAPPEHRAVRSKAGASHGDKSREGSSQRGQRQPSATRVQKTRSSGSSSSSSQMTAT